MLYSLQFPPFVLGLIAGWGTIEENGYLSNTLKSAEVSIKNSGTCARDHRYTIFALPFDTVVCARGENSDSCQVTQNSSILDSFQSSKIMNSFWIFSAYIIEIYLSSS